ncbi:putative RNA polymerase II subunit B1 CTD phosphatase RPAP2 isoform X2 [Venturia canescens]|nr:putative RNA polymerase II subunit B1 CTD phosphatase RPAP2 isoform X2 [Venturia canescens]
MMKKKAECDRIALKIVERMTEPLVDSDWLIKNLPSINRSHMEDVAEERSIVKLCGYVLCDNPLTKVVNKQYQISTLRNKVYDVGKVKNYCSFGCYRAAKFLMEQIQTSPLWLRDQEQAPYFELMEKTNNGDRSSPPGVEINLTGFDISREYDSSEKNLLDSKEVISAKTELENSLSISKETDNFGLELEQRRENTLGTKSGAERKKDSEETSCDITISNIQQPQITLNICLNSINKSSLSQDDRKNNCDSVKESWENSSKSLESGSYETPEKSTKQPRRTKTCQTKNRFYYESLGSRIEKKFREWITDKTVCLLHGQVEEKQVIVERIKREERYEILCKKLNRLQIDEEREAIENRGKLEPAPNFLALQKEARGLELKVRAFWQGQTIIDQESTEMGTSKSQQGVEAEVNTVLPAIDLGAPNALRRRIFIDKLDKVMPELLRALIGESSDLYTTEICACIKTLVSTFALNATNITFKTAEWTLVALLIIKLLGLMDQRIKYLIGNKRAEMYISMILMSYKLDSDYLDNVINAWTSTEDSS